MKWRGRARARERAEAEQTRAELRAHLDAQMRVQLEEQLRTQTMLLEAVQALRADVNARESDVVRVLELAVNVCDHVIECVEADQDERRAIVDTLGRLADAITNRSIAVAGPAPSLPPTPRIIGGNVVAGDVPRDEVIELNDDLTDAADANNARDTVVEVRCRFGDRWVDGFEVCETIHDEDGERYRLRRRSDGTILPELFAADTVRHVETFAELTPALEQRSIWSKI
jgi:hypothetical protein